MTDQLQVNNSTIRLMRGDITDYKIDAFVFYARHDLALGTGFGTAIAMRGGPRVQEALKEMGPLETTQVTVSSAGTMKARHIIHAVGPRFQEENLEEKLAATINNALSAAEARGITRLAFPPMGAGFYGVPLDVSARVTLETIAAYLEKGTRIIEVIVFLLGNRDYEPYQAKLASLNHPQQVMS